jgi:hypothetical protein
LWFLLFGLFFLVIGIVGLISLAVHGPK